MTASSWRKIALALAALHPADRRWMLRRLPSEARRAWRRHAGEAMALVAPDPSAAMTRLTGSPSPVDVDVPEPLTLIRALDTLPLAWAARSLEVVAPDHLDLYKAACRPERQSALARHPASSTRPVPPALAHALAGLLRRLGSVPAGLEGTQR